MFRGHGRRTPNWRANRRLAELLDTMSRHEESYGKQLKRLQELLENESIDGLTYERMKLVLKNDYIRKLDEVKMQLPSAQGVKAPSVDADIQ